MKSQQLNKGLKKLPLKNMSYSGNLFVCTVWIQSQMTNLIVLHKNPHFIEKFIENNKRVPVEFEKIRTEYWKKNFSSIKNDFLEIFFDQLEQKEKENLDLIYFLRNAISHAYISIDRNYLLYKPDSPKKIRKYNKILKVDTKNDDGMFKLDFSNDNAIHEIEKLIGDFDVKTLKKISDYIGVDHEMIR